MKFHLTLYQMQDSKKGSTFNFQLSTLRVKCTKIASTKWLKANVVCNRKWNIPRRKSEVHYYWNRLLHPQIKSSLHYKFLLTQHAKCHSLHVAGAKSSHTSFRILCSWFRASLTHINKCPASCNTKHSIYYSASSLYMFRVSTTPIIRSTQNCNFNLRYWSYFLYSYLPATWPSLATLKGGSCTVPEAVVTVLCTPDDGCGWHPKHVEWTCRIINRLLCVASRWTIINIVFKEIDVSYAFYVIW